MKAKSLKIWVLMTALAIFVAPVFAIPGNGNGPKFSKHVANLESDSTRFGQVIYNTNPEDDDSYRVEVEESSMAVRAQKG